MTVFGNNINLSLAHTTNEPTKRVISLALLMMMHFGIEKSSISERIQSIKSALMFL
jgi:hypothetical protein